jgi:hypothetical protein
MGLQWYDCDDYQELRLAISGAVDFIGGSRRHLLSGLGSFVWDLSWTMTRCDLRAADK